MGVRVPVDQVGRMCPSKSKFRSGDLMPHDLIKAEHRVKLSAKGQHEKSWETDREIEREEKEEKIHLPFPSADVSSPAALHAPSSCPHQFLKFGESGGKRGRGREGGHSQTPRWDDRFDSSTWLRMHLNHYGAVDPQKSPTVRHSQRASAVRFHTTHCSPPLKHSKWKEKKGLY